MWRQIMFIWYQTHQVIMPPVIGWDALGSKRTFYLQNCSSWGLFSASSGQTLFFFKCVRFSWLENNDERRKNNQSNYPLFAGCCCALGKNLCARLPSAHSPTSPRLEILLAKLNAFIFQRRHDSWELCDQALYTTVCNLMAVAALVHFCLSCPRIPWVDVAFPF